MAKEEKSKEKEMIIAELKNLLEEEPDDKPVVLANYCGECSSVGTAIFKITVHGYLVLIALAPVKNEEFLLELDKLIPTKGKN